MRKQREPRLLPRQLFYLGQRPPLLAELEVEAHHAGVGVPLPCLVALVEHKHAHVPQAQVLRASVQQVQERVRSHHHHLLAATVFFTVKRGICDGAHLSPTTPNTPLIV